MSFVTGAMAAGSGAVYAAAAHTSRFFKPMWEEIKSGKAPLFIMGAGVAGATSMVSWPVVISLLIGGGLAAQGASWWFKWRGRVASDAALQDALEAMVTDPDVGAREFRRIVRSTDSAVCRLLKLLDASTVVVLLTQSGVVASEDEAAHLVALCKSTGEHVVLSPARGTAPDTRGMSAADGDAEMAAYVMQQLVALVQAFTSVLQYVARLPHAARAAADSLRRAIDGLVSSVNRKTY